MVENKDWRSRNSFFKESTIARTVQQQRKRLCQTFFSDKGDCPKGKTVKPPNTLPRCTPSLLSRRKLASFASFLMRPIANRHVIIYGLLTASFPISHDMYPFAFCRRFPKNIQNFFRAILEPRFLFFSHQTPHLSRHRHLFPSIVFFPRLHLPIITCLDAISHTESLKITR